MSGSCVQGTFCDGDTKTCRPQAPLGQACGYAWGGESSCTDGATCDTDSSGVGTCVKTPQQGQPCNPSSADPVCDSLLDYCDHVTLKCTRKVPIGGSCSGHTCVSYAVCDESETCVALGRVGDACDNQLLCLGVLQCSQWKCIFPSTPAVCE
jgi:hypothetical protein